MEIKINQDISKFKPKMFFNFDSKQVLGGVVGLLLGYGVYFLEKKVMGEAVVESCIPFVLIPIVWNCFYPRGMSMKVFVKTIFVQTFLNPRNKRWQSDYEFTKEDEELWAKEGYFPFEEENIIKKGKVKKK